RVPGPARISDPRNLAGARRCLDHLGRRAVRAQHHACRLAVLEARRRDGAHPSTPRATTSVAAGAAQERFDRLTAPWRRPRMTASLSAPDLAATSRRSAPRNLVNAPPW